MLRHTVVPQHSEHRVGGYLHVKEFDSLGLRLDLVGHISSIRCERWAQSDLFELCHPHGVFAFHLHQPLLIEIETESLHSAGTRIEGLAVEDDLRSVPGGIEGRNSRGEGSPDNRE